MSNSSFEFVNLSILPKPEKSIFLWLIPFLVPILPFFQPTNGGGTWRVELFAGLLLAGFVFFLLRREQKFEIFADRRELLFFSAPCFGFIVWSALSAIWAESWKNAAHHTLVWACYLIFYAALRQSFARKNFGISALIFLTVLVWLIGIPCIFNYFVAPAEVFVLQAINFSRYGEIFVALFPIFLVLSSTLKNRRLSFICGATATLAWISILCSYNRTCSVLVLLMTIFIGLIGSTGIISHFRIKNFAANAFALLLAFVITTFAASFDANRVTTLSRLTDKNDVNAVEGALMRPLYAGIALEMFREAPIFGVGAENFNLKFAEARRDYSAARFDDRKIEIYEHVFADRAHNEYLQILAELGVVGAAFFLWLLGGVGFLFVRFWRQRKIVSPLAAACLIGLCAFLGSSLVSSFSFRVMQNGLIFFFLFALAASQLSKSEEKTERRELSLARSFAPAFCSLAMIICLSLAFLSTTRAANQYYLAAADDAENLDEAAALYEKAMFFNDDNPAVYFSYGARLFLKERPAEAEPLLRRAIEKGMSVTACFSYLASAQSLAGEPERAEETFRQAVEIYPRSIFARVRYAALLAQNGKSELAEEQRQIAATIDEKQAAGWWLVITEGARAAARSANGDAKTPQPMDLKPNNALYAVLDERHILNPAE